MYEEDCGFDGNCTLTNEYGVLCTPYDDDFWGYEGPFYDDDWPN